MLQHIEPFRAQAHRFSEFVPETRPPANIPMLAWLWWTELWSCPGHESVREQWKRPSRWYCRCFSTTAIAHYLASQIQQICPFCLQSLLAVTWRLWHSDLLPVKLGTAGQIVFWQTWSLETRKLFLRARLVIWTHYDCPNPLRSDCSLLHVGLKRQLQFGLRWSWTWTWKWSPANKSKILVWPKFNKNEKYKCREKPAAKLHKQYWNSNTMCQGSSHWSQPQALAKANICRSRNKTNTTGRNTKRKVRILLMCAQRQDQRPQGDKTAPDKSSPRTLCRGNSHVCPGSSVAVNWQNYMA